MHEYSTIIDSMYRQLHIIIEEKQSKCLKKMSQTWNKVVKKDFEGKQFSIGLSTTFDPTQF